MYIYSNQFTKIKHKRSIFYSNTKQIANPTSRILALSSHFRCPLYVRHNRHTLPFVHYMMYYTKQTTYFLNMTKYDQIWPKTNMTKDNVTTCLNCKYTNTYTNIARGTTDPGIASITWIIFSATKLVNSVARKIQVKYFKIDFSGAWIGCITSKFNHQIVPNLVTRWRLFH